MLSNIDNNVCSHSLDHINSHSTHITVNSESQINPLSNDTQMSLKSTVTKSDKIKESIQQTVSEKSKKRIASIINEIDQFNDIEKLLLYLQLPNGSAQEVDPLKQKGPGNPFGKKADIEVAQTYTWIQSHLEEDSTVSLPKQEVYEEYKAFCDANKFEPLCVADFGKAMKHVFPKVKPRRLGQRGNSKYCYSGLRKKINIETPELPVLDTSSYECVKNERNSETDRNGDSSFGKCLFPDESVPEMNVANNLIIEWASKSLNRNFDSIVELAQYLINSNLVDTRSCDAITLKSTEEKHLKPSSKSNHSTRRRDVQNQLQKKIHEKEANKELKKKSESNKSVDNIKAIQNSLNNSKGMKKNRKNSASKSLDEFECTAVVTSQNAITIKKEPEVELSPTFQTNQLIQSNRLQNKVAIPRTGTPSRIAQPTIQTSIIIVPTATVGLASPQSSITNENTATTTTVSTITSSPLKPTTSKYKRIQPKPVNISRSDSESAVSVASSVECSTPEALSNTGKRRHSVSVPIRMESTAKLRPSDETYNDKHSQTKRQMEERETSVFVNSKKRHIDNIDTINTMLSNNNNNTNSSGFDDANSSNSLSPLSQELQIITGNGQAMCASDIRIQEIESEALMDYFSANPTSVTNQSKDQWDTNHPVNKNAQLSQLRKLLENHLPNATNNKSVQQRLADSVQLETYSELREALLRKNLNNSVQTFGTIKTSNDLNDQNVISISSKEYPKSRQIDGLVTSPVLDNMHCISTITKGSPFASVDYFTPSNQLLNDNNNGLHSNVHVQVPSVPPSPNARRRAFNFQPISPRNTPTIPENAAIDTTGYSNYNLNSTMNSPPQYRLNQKTVGVGPSQPSSEANSPFVSPRSTPVPLSRSRHNSGQSNYSALRQTPLQNFDSGVSSISSSPFISPQSTPVPISRVRAGTGGMQRNFSRVRHSSGPGGPLNMSAAAASLLCHRSNSLSPMIGDTFSNATACLTQLGINELNASQISSLPSNTNKCGTPNSPLSPVPVLQQSDMNQLTNDANHGSSDYVYNPECEVLQSDWSSNRIKTGISNSLVNRHRHSSNPYTSPSTPVTPNFERFSEEIFSLMKNPTNERCENGISLPNGNKPVALNRCQSVPVHQMINSNISIGSKSGHQLAEANSVDLGNGLLDESASISKSYPATPICNQNFQFPPSPPSSTKLQTVMGSDDVISGNVLQSGQDLMVSGVQLTHDSVWNSNIGSTQQNDNELMTINVNSIGSNSSNARRNLNELLSDPPDDLQTTLEDLRDCDNDFSRFAQELEASSAYDDLN